MSLLLRILLLMFVETWIYSMLFHLLCSLDSPPRIVSGITQRIVFCVTRSFYDDQSLLSTWLHVFFLHPTQAFLAIHINCFEPSEPFNTRSFKSPKALWIALWVILPPTYWLFVHSRSLVARLSWRKFCFCAKWVAVPCLIVTAAPPKKYYTITRNTPGRKLCTGMVLSVLHNTLLSGGGRQG